MFKMCDLWHLNKIGVRSSSTCSIINQKLLLQKLTQLFPFMFWYSLEAMDSSLSTLNRKQAIKIKGIARNKRHMH